MALIRANNKTIQNVTTLPTGVTEYNLEQGDLPNGSILQVVQNTTDLTINISSTTTSFTDVGDFTLSITPLKANSKIFIRISGFAMHYNPDTSPPNHGGSTTIMRSVAGGSWTNVVGVDRGLDGIYKNSQASDSWEEHICKMTYLDTPTYTLGQQIQYRAGFRRSTKNTGAFYLNHLGGLYSNGNGLRLVAIAQEIAG